MPDPSVDWREKALHKKHAKLQQARRENEELKRLLALNGIKIPEEETIAPKPARIQP